MTFPQKPYGDMPPSVKRSKTSRAAAASLKDWGPLQKHVYYHIVGRGEYGATADEVTRALERPMSSITARIRELVLAGALIQTERTRLTQYGREAHIYVINRAWKSD